MRELTLLGLGIVLMACAPAPEPKAAPPVSFAPKAAEVKVADAKVVTESPQHTVEALSDEALREMLTRITVWRAGALAVPALLAAAVSSGVATQPMPVWRMGWRQPRRSQ